MSSFNKIHLPRVFNELDKDGDGLVSVEELSQLLHMIGVDVKRDEVELLIGGKSLNYVDFLLFYETLIEGNIFEQEKRKHDEIMERHLRRAFRVFDMNDDGFISCEELQIALSRLELWDENCGQDCRQMINVYDSNGDGLLDFEEFKDMMLMTG